MLTIPTQSTTFVLPFVAGKQRPRLGRYGAVYTPQETTKREQEIADAYIEAGGTKAPKGTPVYVSILVHKALPKRTPKRIFAKADMRRPDIDNVLKLVLDGLNGVAYEDDCQVVQLNASRLWSVPNMGDSTTVVVTIPALTKQDWIIAND